MIRDLAGCSSGLPNCNWQLINSARFISKTIRRSCTCRITVLVIETPWSEILSSGTDLSTGVGPGLAGSFRQPNTQFINRCKNPDSILEVENHQLECHEVGGFHIVVQSLVAVDSSAVTSVPVSAYNHGSFDL